jgi:hypothetical protein
MSATLLTTGLACIIAAIIGGGLKAFAIEIQVLRSWERQGLLGLFGIVLIVAAVLLSAPPPAPREILIIDTKNVCLVYEKPPKPTVFTISQPYHITSIWNYHYNRNQGATPGNISFRRSDGQIFGPWEVNANDLETKENWECNPDVTIPAGQYTVIDSDPATWSWNPGSDAAGCKGTDGVGVTKVKGYPVKGPLDALWNRLWS